MTETTTVPPPLSALFIVLAMSQPKGMVGFDGGCLNGHHFHEEPKPLKITECDLTRSPAPNEATEPIPRSLKLMYDALASIAVV